MYITDVLTRNRTSWKIDGILLRVVFFFKTYQQQLNAIKNKISLSTRFFFKKCRISILESKIKLLIEAIVYTIEED